MKRFLASLLALSLLTGAAPAVSAAEPNSSADYYGSRLKDPAAAAFYETLEGMDFASGDNVYVTDSAVIAMADSYAGGSDKLIRSFGAAVDSFRYDHTDYFYVDWDMLSVNVSRNREGGYVVNVGSGRTDTYLVDKSANIPAQVAEYNTALDAMVEKIRAAADSTSAKDIARAANNAICEAVEYDFCDDPDTGAATEESKYIRTSYGALVNGRAVCEGYSRLYKAILDELGVECELVSGYYLNGESFEPHMWNYVRNDEDGNWYAVDVTMNDSNPSTNERRKYEKYFWQTYEFFAIDHIEDGKVSSVEYVMPYPELHHLWNNLTGSGRFECGTESYEGSPAYWFSFDGKSAAELLEEDGLYMAFRTATTNTGEWVWQEWVSVQEYNRLIPDIAPSVGHKTYFRGHNISVPVMEVGIFDIPDDYKFSEYSYTYSEDAVMNHLIDTISVDNPSHDTSYVAPAYVFETVPANLLNGRQEILQTQHCVIRYDMPLKVVDGAEFELVWDVSSYNKRDLSLEAVQKNAKLENVEFDGVDTISFDFTPSRAFNHNMIFYNFTPRNLVNIVADGKEGVPVNGFTLMYEYTDDVACCKIYNDGRLYINTYAQPSIAMNGDLSTTGWTYEENGETKKVSESQRSQIALVVTVPAESQELDAAAKEQVGEAAEVSKTYEIDLNICGKYLQIPNGSYMKLNLGFPDEFADLVGQDNIRFKLYHFKRNADDTLDYDNPQEIECVVTPYGIVAEVTSFSPYVLVAVDNDKLPEAEKDTSKGIVLVTNGRGGKVECANPVASLKEGQSVTYKLTPDEGYEVEFVRLNNVDVTPAGDTLTLAYEDVETSNTLEVGFVAVEVKEAEEEEGIEPVVPDAGYVVNFDSNGGTPVADAHVKNGGTAAWPEDPTREGFHFKGWYTDKESTEAYDFTTPVTSDITLYAKWTKMELIPEVDATCTEDGNIEYWYCDGCKSCFTDSTAKNMIPVNETKTEKLGHDWSEWTATTAATCMTDGEETRSCSRCNEEEKRAIPAAGSHTWEEWKVTKAPSCTETGVEERNCTKGDAVETRDIAKVDHTWGEWETVKNADCDNQGLEKRVCSVCNAEETKVIPAIGDEHEWGPWEVTEKPTCTKEGVETRTCKKCQKETQTRTVAKLEHECVWTTTESANCTKKGEEALKCTKCDYVEETRPIEALGHSFGEWKVETPALCETAGEEIRTCSVCGETEKRPIDSIGHHEWGKWDEIIKVTCLTDGKKTRTCPVCKEEETETIKAPGHHTLGEWTITKPATCAELGKRTRSCTKCDKYTETEDIPATGMHSVGNWVVETAPTCVDTGSKVRKCANCKYTEEETIGATEIHTPGQFNVITAPTCTEDGKGVYKCTVCEKTVQEDIIFATGHKPGDDKEVTKEPTCTEEGEQSYICSVCGAKIESEAVPALGHDWGDWEGTDEASCTESGREIRECEECGKIETRTVPALGHNFVTDEGYAGLKAGSTYCTRCGLVISGGDSPLPSINPFTKPSLSSGKPSKPSKPEQPAAPTEPTAPSEPKEPAVTEEPTATEEPVDVPVKEMTFTDISADDWFYTAVEYLYNVDIMNGTSATTFSPEKELNRATVVTILYRLENEPAASASGTFSDVSADEWYTAAVEWAASVGLVNGYGDGTYAPLKAVSRQELAIIIYRYAEFKGITINEASASLSENAVVSDWALESVEWAVSEGLLVEGEDINASVSANRAEVAALIYTYLTKTAA